MARFLITTLGGTGHVTPTLSIATTLVERGHEVWWHTDPQFEAVIQKTGAHFVPVKATPQFDHIMTLIEKQGSGLERVRAFTKHLVVEPMIGQLQDYREILQSFPADVLVADSMAFGPKLLHEQGGPPWASVNVTPLTVSSPDVGPFGMALPPARSGFARTRNRFLEWMLAHRLLKETYTTADSLRASVGLAPFPRKSLMDLLMSPFLYLQPTTLAFEYPRHHIPAPVHFIGPLPPPPVDFTPPTWWGDLTAGRPVIHVTQGTVANQTDDLLGPTLQGLADEDVLVVATTGSNTAWHSDVPDNARVATYIPYSNLLPYVNVMITNGGYGGVQSALSHAIPLIAAGESEEKPETCMRIAWSGAGINLKTKAPTPQQIREAVRTILRDPTYKHQAERIKADFSKHDAPMEAAVLLEQLALTKQPV